MRGIEDHFETVDGSRPHASTLSEALARAWPIAAFHLLSQGDVFESMGGRPPPGAAARAQQVVAERVEVDPLGAAPELVARVRADMARQLTGNMALSERLGQGKPIAVDLIPPRHAMTKYGYPRAVSPNTAGLFWDHPSWPKARIALRQDRLGELPALVFHEFAHALHYLAFTEPERDALYRVLLPTYRSRAAADEVFAIYTEREFLPGFSERDTRGPGIYGHTRRRWSEEHVMTRFVRNLYFPYKPLAGPKVAGF